MVTLFSETLSLKQEDVNKSRPSVQGLKGDYSLPSPQRWDYMLTLACKAFTW